MEERQRRIALNEAVFREANERIQELNQTFATFTNELVLVCECGDGECAEKISMPPAEYEQLRSDPAQFAIIRGHEIPEVEHVVAQFEGYDIVRKKEGIPRKVAEVTDPR